ncbi:MAG: UDP-glucuronic acid decarboxylase family protein [Acidobacteriota bacterium]|nr:UDP-glucuronic acid decarboxylase family protein [Acidobacteriota bacterium]
MRILVTGGAGFIGSHLCKSFIEQGHEVLCLDNLFSGSKINVQSFLDHASFEFVRHDIIEPILLEVERIYNLACPASPVHYQYNPVKTVKANVIGTINMLGMAKRVKARILQASTSEVYGDPQVQPQRESYWGNVNPIGLRSCYDEGKRVAETLMMDYHRQNQVDIRIARIFNTYGPQMSINDGRVVSNLIVQSLQGKPLTIYGDGSQTRSFCYVSDMVLALEQLMACDGVHHPVNLGNPAESTILSLAELICELTGTRSDIQFKPLPEDDPVRRRPDISEAHKLLGWKPEVDLKTGLCRTIEYFDNLLRE